MIEWGQKSKPQKIPGPKFNAQKSLAEFPSHKNLQKALNYITRKTETLVLNTQKNTFLNQATPRKYLPKFSYPKKSRNRKFQTPKKSFDHPCHLKSEGHPGDTSRPCLHVNLQMTNDGSVITSVFDVLLIFLVNAVFFSKDELHLPVEVTHGYVGKLLIRRDHR